MRIVVDSKTDYPSACNAMETLLVHEELLTNGIFDKVCHKLKQSGVAIYAGTKQQHRNQSESNKALHDLVASQRYCSWHLQWCLIENRAVCSTGNVKHKC